MAPVKYTSWVTGKRIQVEIQLTESGAEYDFLTEGTLTTNERILLEQEAVKHAQAVINSNLLLG